MSWEALATLAVVALVLYGLARNQLPPDVLFLGGFAIVTTLGMFSDRLPSPKEMAQAFGNEGLLTVAVLFVVAAGLTETGGLSLVTDRILGSPKSALSAQARLFVPVVASSAILNNTPVVAMFVPVVNDWVKKARLSASHLFMPLSYVSILGGICTLIGTSTNLVVKGMVDDVRLTDPSVPAMGMWTITPVGVPVAIAGIAFLLIASRRLLPDRRRETLTTTDPREYTIEMLVEPGGPIAGKTVENAGLRNLPGTFLVEVQRGAQTIAAVGPEEVLVAGDRLVFAGTVEAVVDLQRIRGLAPATDQLFKLRDPRRSRCLLEAVVSNTSPIAGKSIREGQFRTRYEAAVIGVHRNGIRIPGRIGDIVLRAGDTLLIEAHRRFLDLYRNSQDFLLVSAVDRSAPRDHSRSWIALLILSLMVAAMAMESVTNVSVFAVALIAAGLMVGTRCVSLTQARQSIEWPTLIAIGAAIGLGRAMEASGAAAAMASFMMAPFQGHMEASPILAIAVIYIVTATFTEFATNNAAAALAFPIAYATSQKLGLPVMPFAVTVAVAASAGFAMPAGYATHLMVNGPGGYRFSDWMRMGISMDVVVMVATIAAVWLVYFPPA